MQIGVMVDSFRVSLEEGLRKSAALGATGIQIAATLGDMAPENLSTAKRKEILAKIKDYGLLVSAVCGDLGGHGFLDPQENTWKIEKSKRIIDLAREWETDVVTTHVGIIPEDPKHPNYIIMQDVCQELASYGAQVGATFAIETGSETAPVLRAFLDGLHDKGVGVNYDPANLMMVVGQDPATGVHELKDYIVHTHAKDGRMLRYVGAEYVYGQASAGRIEDDSPVFLEVPLGEGQVNFPFYLNALRDIGYDGFLTIEREVGDDPEKDIGQAVQFLQTLLK